MMRKLDSITLRLTSATAFVMAFARTRAATWQAVVFPIDEGPR